MNASFPPRLVITNIGISTLACWLSACHYTVMNSDFADFYTGVRAQNPAEPEFHQAVMEVAKSVWPFYQANPRYRKARILDRMTIPERAVVFRVT